MVIGYVITGKLVFKIRKSNAHKRELPFGSLVSVWSIEIWVIKSTDIDECTTVI